MVPIFYYNFGIFFKFRVLSVCPLHPSGRRVCTTPRTGRGARGATLGPQTPKNLPTTPIHTKAPTPITSTSKGVGQPRDYWLPHMRTSSTGVGITWNIGCLHPCLCSHAAESGGRGSGRGLTLPFTRHTPGEVQSDLATPMPLHIQGGERCRINFHLGGGRLVEGARGGAFHT